MTQRSDSYLGNILVKRDGVQHQFTPHELIEYKRCLMSCEYFARNYIKIVDLDEGLVKFNLYPYQAKMFKHFEDNRFNIVLACRQSGKSITSVVYILHYAIFNPDKTVAVLANKGDTAREMLSRITLALENLPFFLQPGCKALNKGSIHFSNNSKIIARSTSASSIRGMSINLLFLDEFAFVDNDEVFYTSTYPVVTKGKNTKVIITSTANGVGNVFYRLYQGAVQKTNSYVPFRVDWWDVPGRDEAWKKETIANTSQLQFDQEYGNSFLSRGTTLISSDKLLALQAQNPISIHNNVNIYYKPEENHQYVMTVDVCKGRGQDYSTFMIIDVTGDVMKICAVYRDNLISPLLFPDIIYRYANLYNEAYLVIESNDQGVVVCNAIYYEYEYENMFVESFIKAGSIGLNMNKRVKRIGCSNLKDIVEQSKLEILDAEIIRELSTFEAKGTSFEASAGNHDDLVMALVIFAWFVASDIFSEISNVEFKDMLYNEKLKLIEDDLPPAGFLGGEEDNNYIIADGLVWQEVG